jgi:hypothetical protein
MLTILEAAKLNPGLVIRNAVIEMFARASEVLRVLPFQDIQGNAYQYTQEAELPGVAFRGINESYDESTGILNPFVEPLRIAGGDLDVDMFIIKTQGAGVRSRHEAMKVKALAAAWTRAYFKGDNSANHRELDGLQRRVTGAQLIAAGNTAGGDPLSLQKLDEAIDAVEGPTAIWMSRAMRRRLTAAARDTTIGGFITYSTDEFGRQIARYNDLPILIAEGSNITDKILDFDEACPGGGANTGTSIYVTALGDGKVSGIQNGTMDVRDLGEQNEKPVMRTRVEWFSGMVVEHGRAVSRLWGIKDAPVTK